MTMARGSPSHDQERVASSTPSLVISREPSTGFVTMHAPLDRPKRRQACTWRRLHQPTYPNGASPLPTLKASLPRENGCRLQERDRRPPVENCISLSRPS